MRKKLFNRNYLTLLRIGNLRFNRKNIYFAIKKILFSKMLGPAQQDEHDLWLRHWSRYVVKIYVTKVNCSYREWLVRYRWIVKYGWEKSLGRTPTSLTALQHALFRGKFQGLLHWASNLHLMIWCLFGRPLRPLVWFKYKLTQFTIIW